MPELPELETLVRGLRPLVRGRVVRRVWLRHKSLYRRNSRKLTTVIGRRFARTERVGKNAVFRLRPSGVMVINLGMTGRLLVCKRGAEPADLRRKHLHARFTLDAGREMRYYDARRFGHIYVAEKIDFLQDLNVGPDPFIATEEQLQSVLGRRRAPIKALLLDQRILAGVGNIYADEMLFLAGIDPRTPGRRAARHSADILRSARIIMTRAIEHGGSTLRDYRKADGSEGEFQNHHAVYARGGEHCIECGTEIRKIVLAGRGTHFCPNCQR